MARSALSVPSGTFLKCIEYNQPQNSKEALVYILTGK